MTPYEAAKLIHVSCAALSITGFIARFPLALRSAPLLKRRWLRMAPHINDTLLLAAGIVMLVLAQLDPLRLDWLRTKIVLLAVYILLGMVALRPAFSRTIRQLAFVLALATFGYIIAVAMTRNPLGPISWIR
jgi:uncharacterized membrane protein SirB2